MPSALTAALSSAKHSGPWGSPVCRSWSCRKCWVHGAPGGVAPLEHSLATQRTRKMPEKAFYLNLFSTTTDLVELYSESGVRMNVLLELEIKKSWMNEKTILRTDKKRFERNYEKNVFCMCWCDDFFTRKAFYFFCLCFWIQWLVDLHYSGPKQLIKILLNIIAAKYWRLILENENYSNLQNDLVQILKI